MLMSKPDGVKKNLIGEIIARFERRGLKVSALKLVKITEEQAKYHYAEHEGKPFFGELFEFITSGPVAAMVISGSAFVTSSGIYCCFHFVTILPENFKLINFFSFKEIFDFACSGFFTVAAMNDIFADSQRVIAADRTRNRI